MNDLFENTARANSAGNDYSATDIEVLEGLEPVRKRPGMYIGGTDERALHHLVGEILDNAMDEAVAGHANRIEIHLDGSNGVTISDNGRGIPVDDHPKFPGKSALEVILTTLHSGGKFSGKAYQTSGGLHGVGISVVNALSDHMWVEVARDKKLWCQLYSRGKAASKVEDKGSVSNRRGTTVYFHPDPEIFGSKARFKAKWLYRMARSKAYLFRGVEIRWSCDSTLATKEDIAEQESFHFPNGLLDYLKASLENKALVTDNIFHGTVDLPNDGGRVEYAIAWPEHGEGFVNSYCNTVPTPQGGTHENGLRTALSRGLRGYGELVGQKRAAAITAEDVVGGGAILLSLFIRDPQFQGQTKEKLATSGATRLVDTAIKDRFDQWLSSDPANSQKLLDYVIDRAEERQKRRDEKVLNRKSATRKLRLPGKLSDCSRNSANDTEIFIVEGDSAGGSAKQARNRETQAILPLRGKILNVVSATKEKMRSNQEIGDIIQALGCGSGKDFDLEKLRYERIIIMTDADVDGAHIAALLITFFYTQMRPLIDEGHLYLAQPPLYRLAAGGTSFYARDDVHKDALMKAEFKGKKKVDVSRFKGLGEMPAKQLKETTMNPESRTLIRISVGNAKALTQNHLGDDPDTLSGKPNVDTDELVEQLMGKNAEARYNFIQKNAEFVREIDI